MKRSAGETPAGSDSPHFWTTSIDRRRFLIVVGAAAAYAAARPSLGWARKVAQSQSNLQPWALPETAPAGNVELARALIGAGVLAPSHWNSQPWRFEVDTNTIRLVADAKRALPVTDPDQRAMMVSLGAALENLLVASRAYGLRPTVQYFPNDGAGGVVAQVDWASGESRRDRQLFAAIPQRRTNRREYDGRGIFMQNRAQLTAQIPDDLRLHWIDDRDEIREIADVVYDAVDAQVLDRKAQTECNWWTRLDDKDARRRGDGLTLEALDVGGPAKWFSGRYYDPKSWFLRFGAGSSAKQAREGVRSSGALALLCASGRSSAARVIAGQAYERMALKATQLGVAHQPIHAPIQSERHRGELLRRFRTRDEDPLMFVRLGHAKAPPPTQRRAVTLVTSFRNS